MCLGERGSRIRKTIDDFFGSLYISARSALRGIALAMEGEYHSRGPTMDPTKPTEWSLADDMQSFEYTFQQLIDLWPQKAMISGVITAACAFFYADAVLLWLWV